MTQQELELISLIWEVIEENVPIDCQETIQELRKKFYKDLRDLGIKETLKKWIKENESQVDVIIS